jgi:hypothetical protein
MLFVLFVLFVLDDQTQKLLWQKRRRRCRDGEMSLYYFWETSAYQRAPKSHGRLVPSRAICSEPPSLRASELNQTLLERPSSGRLCLFSCSACAVGPAGKPLCGKKCYQTRTNEDGIQKMTHGALFFDVWYLLLVGGPEHRSSLSPWVVFGVFIVPMGQHSHTAVGLPFGQIHLLCLSISLSLSALLYSCCGRTSKRKAKVLASHQMKTNEMMTGNE